MRNFFRHFFDKRDVLKIEVSLAKLGDERAVSEVMYKAWLFAYPNKERGITEEDIHTRWKNAFTEDRLAKRRAEFEHASPNERVFVAKEGTKVLGMCRAVRDESGNRIQAIYVDPDVRGRGIGRALWNEAQKFFDPEKDTYVDVVDYNAQAIGFYEKLGFHDTGKRKQDERFRLASGAIFTEIEMIRKAGVCSYARPPFWWLKYALYLRKGRKNHSI